MLNIPIIRTMNGTSGDTIQFVSKFQQKTDGVITDINTTSWDVFFTIKNSNDDLDANAVVRVNPEDVTTGSDGEVSFNISLKDFSDVPLTPKKYYYDVQIIRDSRPETWWSGDFYITPQTTIREETA